MPGVAPDNQDGIHLEGGTCRFRTENLEENSMGLTQKYRHCPAGAWRGPRQQDGIHLEGETCRFRTENLEENVRRLNTKGHHLGRPSLSEDKLGVALGG